MQKATEEKKEIFCAQAAPTTQSTPTEPTAQPEQPTPTAEEYHAPQRQANAQMHPDAQALSAPQAAQPAQPQAASAFPMPGALSAQYAAPVGGPAYAPAPQAAVFRPDTVDFIFALVFSVIGYLYIWTWTDGIWNSDLPGMLPTLPIFTVLYAAAVLGYLFAKKITPTVESWFWLGVMLCLGVPLVYYSVAPFYQLFLLHLVALYWPVCAAGALLCGGKTGGWILFDCLNAFLIVPYGNFFGHIKAIVKNLRKTNTGRRVTTVLLGVVIAVPLLCMVLPLLSSADAGFSALLREVQVWVLANVSDFLFRLLLSLPVTCVLYGVCCGSIHKRRTELFQPNAITKSSEAVRVLPGSAVLTVFLLIGAVYTVFLAMQGSYAFGAFAGRLPSGFSYSTYAREGFFELCRLGTINLCVLLGANLLCRKPRRESVLLRGCNLVLCVLSLLLTATAAAKLGMYIRAYGLTVNRVVPAVFLLWMALVFTALIVWQFRRFSVVRLAALAGAALVCSLCVVDVTSACEAYNTARVERGTLQDAGSDTSYSTRYLGSDTMMD